MDGYAVVASDGPGEYLVITESRAGNDGIGVTITPGTVAYVTTGGPIPDGANAVVQVEDTEEVIQALGELKRVRILMQARHGLDIRPVGCDIEKDTVVLKAGEQVGPAEIGLLATVGVMEVKVHPSPTIAVLSTGDELVEATTGCLSRGQVLRIWDEYSFVREVSFEKFTLRLTCGHLIEARSTRAVGDFRFMGSEQGLTEGYTVQCDILLKEDGWGHTPMREI
ncbi:hypothetical protein GIB67_005461 [Kingdonia uniflora]|uniref:Molybdopterin biosynthesis protein CNX1 n=1 Tax=Kingdonia uniflora TaxID=39325 RepID=A0A7J7NH94_9MAGN|nr:hypothetical protein GIB67_005461 [Kingdonia uniflora]